MGGTKFYQDQKNQYPPNITVDPPTDTYTEVHFIIIIKIQVNTKEWLVFYCCHSRCNKTEFCLYFPQKPSQLARIGRMAYVGLTHKSIKQFYARKSCTEETQAQMFEKLGCQP